MFLPVSMQKSMKIVFASVCLSSYIISLISEKNHDIIRLKFAGKVQQVRRGYSIDVRVVEIAETAELRSLKNTKDMIVF